LAENTKIDTTQWIVQNNKSIQIEKPKEARGIPEHGPLLMLRWVQLIVNSCTGDTSERQHET